MIDEKELFEFCKAFSDMCKKHRACEGCELIGHACFAGGLFGFESIAEVRFAVRAVKKWVKERDEETRKAELARHLEWLRDNGAECFVERHEEGDKFVVVVDYPKGNGDGKA